MSEKKTINKIEKKIKKKSNEKKLSKKESNEKELSKKEKKISEKKIMEFNINIDKYKILYYLIKKIGLMVLRSYALGPYSELQKYIYRTWMGYNVVNMINYFNGKSSIIKTDSKGNKVRTKIKINRNEFGKIIKRFTSLTLKPLGYLNKSLSIVSNLILFHFVITLINGYTGGSVLQLGQYLLDIFKDNHIIMTLIKNIDIEKIQSLSIQDLYAYFFVYESQI